jgi:hypothetical protein
MMFYRRFHCKHGGIPSFLAQLFTWDLLRCHSIPTRYDTFERATRRSRTKTTVCRTQTNARGGEKLLLLP